MTSVFRHLNSYVIPAEAERVLVEGVPHVRIVVDGRKTTFTVSKDGEKYLKPAAKWYGKYIDEHGVERRKPLSADKAVAWQMLTKIEREVERKKAGLFDPTEEHARKPLSEHLADYSQVLESKGNTESHTRKTIASLVNIFEGCQFVYPSDVEISKISKWMNDQRKGVESIQVPPGEVFTMSECVSILGISRHGVFDYVKRYNLEATGRSSARRYPRATLEAIATRMATGVGPSTINHHIRALRAFFRWMFRYKRISFNPVDSLELVPEDADIRRARRELTESELMAVFTATRNSTTSFRGLSGEDRFHLYLTASATGFRASAVAGLTKDDFRLEGEQPAIRLYARLNKSRKPKMQPIPIETAIALQEYLRGVQTDGPVWGTSWLPDAVDMLRQDLEVASVPYVIEGDNGPEDADFHSLRHSYLTMLGRNGVDLRTAQELAGHSTPLLTARYSHRNGEDLANAVGKLPKMVPVGEIPHVPIHVPTPRTASHSTARICTTGLGGERIAEGSETVENVADCTDLHSSASTCIEWSLPGLNRGPSDFQSLALPAELSDQTTIL
jgi:integrase/recombinase XerC